MIYLISCLFILFSSTLCRTVEDLNKDDLESCKNAQASLIPIIEDIDQENLSPQQITELRQRIEQAKEQYSFVFERINKSLSSIYKAILRETYEIPTFTKFHYYNRAIMRNDFSMLDPDTQFLIRYRTAKVLAMFDFSISNTIKVASLTYSALERMVEVLPFLNGVLRLRAERFVQHYNRKWHSFFIKNEHEFLLLLKEPSCFSPACVHEALANLYKVFSQNTLAWVHCSAALAMPMVRHGLYCGRNFDSMSTCLRCRLEYQLANTLQKEKLL